MLPVEHAGATENDAFKESGELRKRAAKTFDDVNKYISQLEEIERALSLVSRADSGNLRKRYASFSRGKGKLEKAQKRAMSDIDKLKRTGTEYFSAWDK